MILICPHDGHAVDEVRASGPNCARHGVPWFTNCPKCRWDWPVLAKDHWMREETDYKGQDFCAECAAPAPWLSRPRLLAWVRDQLKASAASGDVPRGATLELIEALKRLDAMGADDAPGWSLSMILICPHAGHAVDEVRASGPNSARHGRPWCTNCPKCRWDWPVP